MFQYGSAFKYFDGEVWFGSNYSYYTMVYVKHPPRSFVGLSISDAVRLLLTRVAREKALPFTPLIPNAETIAAMKEARTGNRARFDDVESLIDDLHEGD